MTAEIRSALETTGWLDPMPLNVAEIDSVALLTDMELALRKVANVCIHTLGDGSPENAERIRNSVLVGHLELAAKEVLRLRRGIQSEVLRPAFASGRKNAGADDQRIRLRALFARFLDFYGDSFDSVSAAKQRLVAVVREAGKKISVRTVADDVAWVRLGRAGELDVREWDGYVEASVSLAFADVDWISDDAEHKENLLELVMRTAARCESLKPAAGTGRTGK